MTVNGAEYTVLQLLGKGKGGYSYLVTDGAAQYVLKQIHHEPCEYYTFGDKLQAELQDYETLRKLGIPMPRLLAVDVPQVKQASVIASILYFPMLIFSGTTLPLEVMPTAMQKVVSFFPLTQGLTMMKNAFLGIGMGNVLVPVCVMLGLTALCTALAVRFFRWE